MTSLKIWHGGILLGILLGIAVVLWLTMEEKNPPISGEAVKQTETNAPIQKFGFIRSVTVTGSTSAILFDEARWLNGREGEDAAIKAGICTEETRSDCLPNDFFIENTATDTVSLSFSDATRIYLTTYKTGEPDDDPEEVTLPEFAALINNPQLPWSTLPYHVKIAADTVVIQIEEQYVP